MARAYLKTTIKKTYIQKTIAKTHTNQKGHGKNVHKEIYTQTKHTQTNKQPLRIGHNRNNHGQGRAKQGYHNKLTTITTASDNPGSSNTSPGKNRVMGSVRTAS